VSKEKREGTRKLFDEPIPSAHPLEMLIESCNASYTSFIHDDHTRKVDKGYLGVFRIFTPKPPSPLEMLGIQEVQSNLPSSNAFHEPITKPDCFALLTTPKHHGKSFRKNQIRGQDPTLSSGTPTSVIKIENGLVIPILPISDNQPSPRIEKYQWKNQLRERSPVQFFIDVRRQGPACDNTSDTNQGIHILHLHPWYIGGADLSFVITQSQPTLKLSCLNECRHLACANQPRRQQYLIHCPPPFPETEEVKVVPNE
jgi:hypothetical protein